MLRLILLALVAGGCTKKEDPPVICMTAEVVASRNDCDYCPNPSDPDGQVVPCDQLLTTDTGTPTTDTDSGETGDDTASAGDDVDGDGFTAEDDCDDGNSSVHPDAGESCNDRDDNCDGAIDEGVGTTWYLDGDDDGYGDPDRAQTSCEQPSWTVSNSSDCDDGDDAVHPGAEEICDGIDNDCDDEEDNDPVDGNVYYVDADGDGWGKEELESADDILVACEMPEEGYAAFGNDCDDEDSAYHPSAPESDCADPADYNCDGYVGYADRDGDGWAACEECDDGNAAVRPDASEQCNEVDDNCDGEVDYGAVDAERWYVDADGDGYGDADDYERECEQPFGRVADNTDCNDGDEDISPDAAETCDAANVDEDCDGLADDADLGVVTGKTVWYRDVDTDTYGDPASVTMTQCEQPTGYVNNAGDCDDLDRSEPAIDACE